MELLKRKIDTFLGSWKATAGHKPLIVKGAMYENVVEEMLVKSGYGQLYFYRRENPAVEMDFFVRDAIP